jgi:hypothetical protein
MSLPITDSFTGSNDTLLESYSANWVSNAGDMAIYDNSVCPYESAAEEAYHRSDETFDADQYAQGTILETSDPSFAVGVAVRCAASGANYYGMYTASNFTYLFVVSGGTWTQLGWTGSNYDNGYVMRLEISGTTLTPKLNGAVNSEIGAVEDETLASGYAGVSGYSSSIATRLDDWEGGNLGGAVTFQPRPPVAIDSMFMY